MSGLSAVVRDLPRYPSSARSGSGLAGMNSYPADERRISEVERGRSWDAILPFPPGKSLSPGDSIIFALASPDANREPRYVSGGDSVRVVLTEVTDIASHDPATGRALFRLSWAPLGQQGSLRPPGEHATDMRPVRAASPRWYPCSPRPRGR